MYGLVWLEMTMLAWLWLVLVLLLASMRRPMLTSYGLARLLKMKIAWMWLAVMLEPVLLCAVLSSVPQWLQGTARSLATTKVEALVWVLAWVQVLAPAATMVQMMVTSLVVAPMSEEALVSWSEACEAQAEVLPPLPTVPACQRYPACIA
jgi:hypothetical protein